MLTGRELSYIAKAIAEATGDNLLMIKASLKSLPMKTRACMTKQQAETLAGNFSKLGAVVEVFQA